MIRLEEGKWHVGASQHRERLSRLDIDNEVIAAARIERIRKPTEPAIRVAAIGGASLPVSHRGEMRETRVVIADPVDDRELAVFEQALKSRHPGLYSELVVEPAKLFRSQPELRPRAIVGVVCIGDDGVQAVIGAGEFDHDEDARTNSCWRRGGGFINWTRAKPSDAATEADQPRTQHVAPADFTKQNSLRHCVSLRSGQLILGRAHDYMRRQA